MGMPAGCGKEAIMVDEKKRRRIGIRDRIRIQACLESGMPPSKIAEDTGFSKSAICREVSSRSTFEGPREMRCRQGRLRLQPMRKKGALPSPQGLLRLRLRRPRRRGQKEGPKVRQAARGRRALQAGRARLAEDQARPVGPPHPRDRPGGRRDMLREDPKVHPVRRAALGEGP